MIWLFRLIVIFIAPAAFAGATLKSSDLFLEQSEDCPITLSHFDGQNLKVLIQLGWIDESTHPGIVYHPAILEAFDQLLTSEECGFSRNSNFEYKKNTTAVAALIIQLRLPDAENSPPQPSRPQVTRDLLAEIATADAFIYIGHSRNGVGLDQFPKRLKERFAVPIFSNRFVQSLPSRLQVAAYISCNSKQYSVAQGASSAAHARGLALYTISDNTFNFQESTRKAVEILNSVVWESR